MISGHTRIRGSNHHAVHDEQTDDLRRKYPPNELDGAVELVLQQTAVISEGRLAASYDGRNL